MYLHIISMLQQVQHRALLVCPLSDLEMIEGFCQLTKTLRQSYNSPLCMLLPVVCMRITAIRKWDHGTMQCNAITLPVSFSALLPVHSYAVVCDSSQSD